MTSDITLTRACCSLSSAKFYSKIFNQCKLQSLFGSSIKFALHAYEQALSQLRVWLLPCHCSVECEEHNFPELLKLNFLGECIDIARKCVQPPLRKSPKSVNDRVMSTWLHHTPNIFTAVVAILRGERELPMVLSSLDIFESLCFGRVLWMLKLELHKNKNVPVQRSVLSEHEIVG